MIFLDTTFLVDILRKDPAALSWLKDSEEVALYTSEINAFELYTGLFRLSKKSESSLRKRRMELEQVLTRTEVLPFERAAALEAGKILADLLKQGTPIGSRDVMIAGISLANGMHRILTRNVKHFKAIRQIIVESY
ncbi:MAG: type II toxin-antitoxin system VapC family toxin [Candidatus Thorarchaeota archaeon]|nr:type II toxin-antitoxin system VapC family toxin [Candidatus Thorarchaeota archaeon]